MLAQIDAAVLHAVQSSANSALDFLMLIITFVGNPAFWFIVATFIYWQGRRKDSFFLMTLVMCVAALVGVLKPMIARLRPSAEEFRVLTGDLSYVHFAEYNNMYSFPSGHAAMIASAYSYFANFVSKRKKSILIVLVLIVAFSRMYLGAHFISDVIAGLVLGYFIGKGMFLIYDKAKEEDFSKIDSNIEFATIALMVVLFAVFVSYQPLGLTAAVAGFYSGMFICWQQGIKQKKLKGKILLLKEAVGFAILALILAIAALNKATEIEVLLFFFVGFWVSFIWPIFFDNVVGRDGRSLAG